MDSNDPVSRRNWLGLMSAASLTSGVLAAQPPAVTGTAPGTRVYNIVDFGAKGDGKTLDTQAVQAAIDACTKDQGGTVLVPAGVFVIGTVEMKSNVTLHLAARGNCLVAPTANSTTPRTRFRSVETPRSTMETSA